MTKDPCAGRFHVDISNRVACNVNLPPMYPPLSPIQPLCQSAPLTHPSSATVVNPHNASRGNPFVLQRRLRLGFIPPEIVTRSKRGGADLGLPNTPKVKRNQSMHLSKSLSGLAEANDMCLKFGSGDRVFLAHAHATLTGTWIAVMT